MKREFNDINCKPLGIYESARKNKNLLYAKFELLNRCNWRCKHCYLDNYENNGLSKQRIFKALDELWELGCFEVEFTGGEIFCREDTLEIIEYARKCGFNVVLFTNISLLNEEKIMKLAKLHVTEISCTIFSTDSEVHDKITGIKGSYDAAMKNVELLKKYNFDLQIKTILMKDNWDAYKGLHDFCDKKGIKYLATSNIFPRHNGDCTPQNLLINKEQLIQVLPEIDRMRGFSNGVTKNPDDYICDHCLNIRLSISIDCNGTVYPCDMLPISIGNIKKSTIGEIWNNSTKLHELQEFKWKDLDGCSSCYKKDFCMRCAGVALTEKGRIDGSTRLECELAEIRYEHFVNENNK